MDGQMISIAIVDSGPLIAAANAADPAHQSCVDALKTSGLHLVIPALCVAEAAYLIQQHQGPQVEAQFLRALAGFDVQAPTDEDWPRIADLVAEYADFPLGGTDASVVATGERLGTDLLITLDRRHFSAVRPLHRERFRLIPE